MASDPKPLSVFVSASLSTEKQRARNGRFAELLDPFADVYLPQRDGGLLLKLLESGVVWDIAAARITERDVRALRDADLLIAVFEPGMVGGGVAFEIGFAHAVETPVWCLLPDQTERPRSPLLETAISRRFQSTETLLNAIRRLERPLRPPR
ncbi:MAG: hypothetical protein GY725_24880 [bacterium]|nr:hypothetical protein [bacterium]